MNTKENYVVIWRDEQSWDAWKDYCYATGASRDCEYIKIYFDPKDVEEGEHITESEDEEEEEEEL